MDINSMLNDGPTVERRPSSRQMSISHRADSISSTTPSLSAQSPKINGHATSTPTTVSFERPRSSDERAAKPLPEKSENMGAPAMKRKRENGEQGPKKRRLQEPPIWARKIPERTHSGLSWHMLPRAPSSGSTLQRRGSQPGVKAASSSPQPQQQQQPAVPAPAINPFGSTYCNTTPGDELTRNVADFLFLHVRPLLDILPPENIEIEAKLGKIINRDTDDRVVLPVQTEAAMKPNPGGMRTLFQSSMTEAEHMHFNKQLNEIAIRVPGPNGKTHERIQDIDSFWQLPRAEAIANIPGHLHPYVLGPGNAPVKVRISNAWSDSGRGPEKACIIKRRINNLDIYNPNWLFDWRVSVNIEYQYTGSRAALEPATEGNGARIKDRAKNRLKYFYPVCDIDFTKVTTVPAGEIPGAASWEEHEHELEVELHSARLYEQIGIIAKQNVAHRYEDLVRVLVDNVRVLTRSFGR